MVSQEEAIQIADNWFFQQFNEHYTDEFAGEMQQQARAHIYLPGNPEIDIDHIVSTYSRETMLEQTKNWFLTRQGMIAAVQNNESHGFVEPSKLSAAIKEQFSQYASNYEQFIRELTRQDPLTIYGVRNAFVIVWSPVEEFVREEFFMYDAQIEEFRRTMQSQEEAIKKAEEQRVPSELFEKGRDIAQLAYNTLQAQKQVTIPCMGETYGRVLGLF